MPLEDLVLLSVAVAFALALVLAAIATRSAALFGVEQRTVAHVQRLDRLLLPLAHKPVGRVGLRVQQRDVKVLFAHPPNHLADLTQQLQKAMIEADPASSEPALPENGALAR
jgi:hypothetical protein